MFHFVAVFVCFSHVCLKPFQVFVCVHISEIINFSLHLFSHNAVIV